MGWWKRFKAHLEELQQRGGMGAQMRPKVKLRVRVYRVATNTWQEIPISKKRKWYAIWQYFGGFKLSES